jgi:2-polyprenyl-6-methoxyphenol hydroxylase-like FAD-dependent oxidoreductase
LKLSHVGIVGGGIAGNALAQFLAQQNIKVTILEKVANPSPVGSGIMLQKPALAILEKLNIRSNIESNGVKIKGFSGLNKKGKTIIDFNFIDVNPDLYGLGVHRGSIFSNLLEQSNANPLIDIQLSATVVSVKDTKEKVIVNLEDGRSFDFELLIVANGSGSKLRDQYPSIVKQSKMQSYAALWTTLPYDPTKFDGKISQVYHKSEHMYGLMPIGFPTNAQEGLPQINFFCAITKEYFENWSREKFDEWKQMAYNVAPNYKEYIDQIISFDQLVATPYFDAKLSPFYSGRVAFVGDACHALSPHLSAGVNLALMDVYELSKAIAEEQDYQSAYKRYFETRKEQVNYYYFISRLITPMFQSKTNLGWIRDFFIPILYSVSWTKKLMVETISGIRKNFFSTIDKEFYEG